MRAITGAGLMVGLLVAGSVLAGCGSSTDGAAQPSSGTASTLNSLGLEKDVPKSYNPCTDVPESVLKSERLGKAVADNKANAEGLGGVIWRGCGWVMVSGNGYATSIQVTNMTLAFVREHFYNQGQELTIAGRPAIIARNNETRPREVCSINVEMKGGSLEFQLDNPPSNRDTGKIDTCQLGLALAEKVVPTLPAGA